MDDLEAAVAKVESNGGKILIPPQEIPDFGGSFAMFLDPSGNIIGLTSNSTILLDPTL